MATSPKSALEDHLNGDAAPMMHSDKEIPVSQIDMSTNKEYKTVVEDDDESFSTVLSEQSQSDDESLVASDSSSLRQLETEFRVRDKILRKLVKGIDPIYAQVLRDNEEAARKAKMLRAQEKHKQLHSSPKFAVKSRSTDVAFSHKVKESNGTLRLLERIQMTFACDLYNTIPGAAHLLLYCLAHACCFQITDVCIAALTQNFQNQDAVYITLILVSILVLRMTGGMWSYLVYESYGRVKFDLHNRLRLGKVDAHVVMWFRQHPKIQTFVDLVAFYTSFLCISYLHERMMEILDRNLCVFFADGLGALKQRILSGNSCAVDGICDWEKEGAIASERDYTMYYVVSAVLAIAFLQILGHPFLRR